MSAYIIVSFTPKDKEKLQAYSASVPATLKAFDGEMVVKGPVESLHGQSNHAMQAVLGFPNKDKALSWYQSEEYQQLLPIRDEGMEAEFKLVG